ncbi:hypothetical protein TNCV_1024161 [Trichonephila clavipes]|nr:hypothetical protein TNCV_1024161 [Trichonephila clavipes]
MDEVSPQVVTPQISAQALYLGGADTATSHCDRSSCLQTYKQDLMGVESERNKNKKRNRKKSIHSKT